MKGVIEIKVEKDGISVAGSLRDYVEGKSNDKEAALIATLVQVMGDSANEYMAEMEEVNQRISDASTLEEKEQVVKEWAAKHGKDPDDYGISSIEGSLGGDDDGTDDVPPLLH